MRLFNFFYDCEDSGALEALNAKLAPLKTEQNIFIQLFDATLELQNTRNLMDKITAILPQAKIIAASAPAAFADGQFCEKKIALCVSIFQKTTVQTLGFAGGDCAAAAAAIGGIISEKTKLLILIANPQTINATNLLAELDKITPNIALVGGKAGDYLTSTKIYVAKSGESGVGGKSGGESCSAEKGGESGEPRESGESSESSGGESQSAPEMSGESSSESHGESSESQALQSPSESGESSPAESSNPESLNAGESAPLSLVCAALDSDVLQIHTDYIFEWNGIGIEMTVTSSDDNGWIRTINGVPTREIYRKYLGDLVADALPNSGFEFPLMLEEEGFLTARVLTDAREDGALHYSEVIKQGKRVKFGISSIVNIKQRVDEAIKKLESMEVEGIYSYSCVTRYIYLRSTILEYETSRFNNVAPTGGFFTYGEFFRDTGGNKLLNITNTYIALSEGLGEAKIHTSREIEREINRVDSVIYSLSHLASVSSRDYDDVLRVFGQYKEILEKGSILLYLNREGVIINANENFLKTSKYEKKEILGKKLGFVISEKSKHIAEALSRVLSEGRMWNGILHNKAADSSDFYTKAILKPITDSKGKMLIYICCMDDITEYETKRQNLTDAVNTLTEISLEKDRAIQEYQTLLDRSTAMIRVRAENLIEVNRCCEQLFGYKHGEMLNRHITTLFDKSKLDPAIALNNLRYILATKGYLKAYFPCVDKNGKKMHVQAYLMAIKISHTKQQDEEVVGILHNVTELFNTQQELIDIQKEIIYAMGSISEGRSRETGNHVKRVAEYCYLLGKFYGLSEEQAALLKLASPMHDIGKLAIPDAILHKPGKLTDEEFEIMKTHAQRGYEMLAFSDRPILKTSAQIALTHHEWWNGNGYPQKLKGEEIPLFGRITAVADVFDALSNDRCYKKAWPLDEVIEHMKKNKGVQFQSQLIDILVEHLDDFKAIQEKFRDVF